MYYHLWTYYGTYCYLNDYYYYYYYYENIVPIDVYHIDIHKICVQVSFPWKDFEATALYMYYNHLYTFLL